MDKINKILLMVIAMAAIMITAVGIDRGIQHYSTWKWRKEQVERCETARADVAQMQMTIGELSQDQKAIEAFIEENKQYFDEDYNWDASPIPEDIVAPENNEAAPEGNGLTDISDNELQSLSENSISGDTVSGNEASGSTVSENTVSENTVSGNTVSGNTVSGNTVSENTISGNTVSENDIFQAKVSGNSLLERRKIRGSYEETIRQSQRDQEIIRDSRADFSDMKIACLGDSITAAANLENMDDYQQYAYPTVLKNILGASRIDNLGIGGSSIGRYWENAFVDRYKEIPGDTDLIIVMGGTNDGFCVAQKDFGSMEKRSARTFIGDLDQLIRGLKKDYPDAQIVLVTPLPNVLHDILRKERDYLLPQHVFADAMKELAGEYELPVIDLYHSNILDSHDAAVIYNYMPDGVHCNPAGYEILAQHIGAQLISLYEKQEE